jgi:outer membrane protein OmpA-like peptidoglycan-associated protein
LAGQQGWLSRLLPSGVSEIPGLHALADYAGQAGGAVRDAAQAGGRAVRGAAQEAYRSGVGVAQGVKPWASALVPLVLIALALAALPWLIRAWTTKERPVASAPEVKASDMKDTARRVAGYGPDLSKLTNIKLPDGVNLEVPETSFLHRVHKFLSGPTDTKSQSFVFERLNFDGASVRTTPETETAVKALGMLVKAFPGVQLRIEGHTDNAGDADANRRLSLDRANTVKELLVKVGVPADRISTEGLGADKPIAPNDTEENRAKNRRIELSFVKK